MKGDWEAAKAFLDKCPDCVLLPITMEKATVLHSAAAAKHANFVEEVLKWMTPGDLELKTIYGDTALHFAAQAGEVKIAKEMVEKNNELPLIHNNKEMIPLHTAADKRDRKMVDFLFSDSVTPFQRLTTDQRIELLLLTVSAGFYGMPCLIYVFGNSLNLYQFFHFHNNYSLKL
jgi:ankyrin repeat protein